MGDGVTRRGKIFHMSSVEYKDLLQTIPVMKGISGEAILLIGTLPTINNTVKIGGETWTFVAAAASMYQVTRGASAATAIAALVAKINANTALYILASDVTTGMKIQFAQTAGGTAKIGTPTSLALTETLTDVADIWNQDNLNAIGQTNHIYATHCDITASTENIATVFTIPMKFTVTTLRFRVVSADGTPLPSRTAKAEIVATGVQVTFTNGGDPGVAGDVMYIDAYGSVLL